MRNSHDGNLSRSIREQLSGYVEAIMSLCDECDALGEELESEREEMMDELREEVREEYEEDIIAKDKEIVNLKTQLFDARETIATLQAELEQKDHDMEQRQMAIRDALGITVNKFESGSENKIIVNGGVDERK